MQPRNKWLWDMTVILIHVPSAPGVYTIWRDEICLYVGETNDLLSRLVVHCQEVNLPLAAERPTSFWFETHHGMSRVARRSSLIGELKPSLNPDES